MPQDLSLGFGLQDPSTVFKRKFRWLFKIPDISAQGFSALPPNKGARPTLSFRENEVQHLTETVYFPGKPEWKTFSLSLYDIPCNDSPIYRWLAGYYNPQIGDYYFAVDSRFSQFNFKKNALLEMYDPCGNAIEQWVFEDCWPVDANFGELDMASSDVTTVDLTIRYSRAYIFSLATAIIQQQDTGS